MALSVDLLFDPNPNPVGDYTYTLRVGEDLIKISGTRLGLVQVMSV